MTDTQYAIMKIVTDSPHDNGWCHMGLKDREIITHILGEKIYLTNTSDNIFRGTNYFERIADIITEYIIEITFDCEIIPSAQDIIDNIQIERLCHFYSTSPNHFESHILNISGAEIPKQMCIKNKLLISVSPKNKCYTQSYYYTIKLKKNTSIKSIVCRNIGIISSDRKQILEYIDNENKDSHISCDN
jgi:hypothetical protein